MRERRGDGADDGGGGAPIRRPVAARSRVWAGQALTNDGTMPASVAAISTRRPSTGKTKKCSIRLGSSRQGHTRLLRANLHVLSSDVDVVWLRDPVRVLPARPGETRARRRLQRLRVRVRARPTGDGRVRAEAQPEQRRVQHRRAFAAAGEADDGAGGAVDGVAAGAHGKPQHERPSALQQSGERFRRTRGDGERRVRVGRRRGRRARGDCFPGRFGFVEISTNDAGPHAVPERTRARFATAVLPNPRGSERGGVGTLRARRPASRASRFCRRVPFQRAHVFRVARRRAVGRAPVRGAQHVPVQRHGREDRAFPRERFVGRRRQAFAAPVSRRRRRRTTRRSATLGGFCF